MSLASFVIPVFAALSTPPPSTPAPGPASPSGAAPALPQIRDIAPPIDVFPYPPWMVAVAGVLALAILGFIVWAIVRWLRQRPPAIPDARAVAVRQLENLRQLAATTEPYPFSFEVSDVLRTFISKGRFHLPATQQTSPEFLASISASPMFTDHDRTLLERFLEKCDMIKFARVTATSGDNVELVESALAFVRGGTPA